MDTTEYLNRYFELYDRIRNDGTNVPPQEIRARWNGIDAAASAADSAPDTMALMRATYPGATWPGDGPDDVAARLNSRS